MNQPMYFAELTVENVRCFSSRQVLDLRDGNGRLAQWTVILGDNGVGKTTLLQCLYGMKPTVLPPMPGAMVGTVPDSTYWAPELKQGLRRSLSEEDSQLKASIAIGTSLGDASDATALLSLDEQWNARKASGSQYSSMNADMFCCGYGASRRPGRTALSADSRPWAAATLFSDSAELINVEEWLLQADYSARSNAPGASKRFEHIRETILRLLENVSAVRIEGLDKVPPQPIVQLETPYGWVRPHQLSLGYRAMLSWVLDLASRMFERYPTSEDPLSEPAVVLVDEIDLHLHPRWQRDIVRFLSERFQRTQFIVTAHSPLIVQAAENANLVVLHRAPDDGDHVLIQNDPEIVRGWRVDQLLTSDLFGLTSARPPGFTKLLERRGELLEKATRTPEEEQELANIERELQSMPTGETPEDIDAGKTIRWFAEQLRKDTAHS
ncbi:AAA family ATPase [Archangium violaceum]|uniref:AAA family ATPase n=1 Tax=Archangium violaceum TaxID=83451 RepID=UPI00195045D0|nr:AAA family ATPase [Archangium violaceum]QRN95185.1 AAA family ATPase [Archangium violaceum]